MEATGAMVSTMGGIGTMGAIGAMGTTTTTSQDNVQDIMEGKGEVPNNYRVVEGLLETMEATTQDTTMAAVFVIVNVQDLLSAAIFTMDINVHSHSTMGKIF